MAGAMASLRPPRSCPNWSRLLNSWGHSSTIETSHIPVVIKVPRCQLQSPIRLNNFDELMKVRPPMNSSKGSRTHGTLYTFEDDCFQHFSTGHPWHSAPKWSRFKPRRNIKVPESRECAIVEFRSVNKLRALADACHQCNRFKNTVY